jgi:hypothetical protein
MKLWHLYAAIGVVGLVLTGSQALGYFSAGPVGGTVEFWRDAFHGDDASRFLAVDILALVTALFVFIWVEGRRLGISAGWRLVYVLGSTLVASAAFVPFFLAHRQRVLNASR